MTVWVVYRRHGFYAENDEFEVMRVFADESQAIEFARERNIEAKSRFGYFDLYQICQAEVETSGNSP